MAASLALIRTLLWLLCLCLATTQVATICSLRTQTDHTPQTHRHGTGYLKSAPDEVPLGLSLTYCLQHLPHACSPLWVPNQSQISNQPAPCPSAHHKDCLNQERVACQGQVSHQSHLWLYTGSAVCVWCGACWCEGSKACLYIREPPHPVCRQV